MVAHNPWTLADADRPRMTREIANAFVLTYAALFPIVNPIGGAPIFLSMTYTCAPSLQHTLAWRVGVASFALLTGALLLGSHLLDLLGLSLPAVRIGGGLVVAAMGWRLLNAQANPVELHPDDRASSDDRSELQRVFYPLTMPLTVGPGSIATAIALGSTRPLGPHLDRDVLFQELGALAGLLGISASVYLCYRYASQMTRLLGASGVSIMTRLSAFLLFCIGIQIIWNGLDTLIPGLAGRP